MTFTLEEKEKTKNDRIQTSRLVFGTEWWLDEVDGLNRKNTSFIT